MTFSRLLTSLLLAAFISGCNKSQPEFQLPQGNVEQGKMSFILLQCNDCHSVAGVDWNGGSIHVTLGGKTTKLKSDQQLVTSIINPSHKLSRGLNEQTVDKNGHSKMRNYNEVMSVQELIDLVAFLKSKYQLWNPDKG